MALLKGFGLFNTCVSSHTSKIRSRSLTSLDSSALILFLILLCFFDTVLHDRTPRKLNTVLPCSAPYWYRVYAGVKKKKSPALLADGSELDISPHCATLLFRWVLTGYRFALCLIAVLWFQLRKVCGAGHCCCPWSQHVSREAGLDSAGSRPVVHILSETLQYILSSLCQART